MEISPMKKFFILPVIVIMSLLISCSYSGKTGKVTLNFGMPVSQSKASFIPSGIEKITVTVYAPDIEKIGPLDVDPAADSITFEVPAGGERKFDVKAYNSDHIMIFQGSAVSYINSGDNIVTVSMRIALADVYSFNAVANDGSVSLNWTNPEDKDFAGVHVMRRADASPVDEYDGVLVYTGKGTAFSDTGLNNGTTYYYTIFAFDVSGNFSAGVKTDANAGIIFFAGRDSVNGTELWATDGTASGTRIVKNIAGSTTDSEGSYISSEPDGFIYYNGKTYFIADDGTYGKELWVTDGSEAGTVMLKDINTTIVVDSSATYGSNPSNFVVYNNKLYFSAAGSYDTSNDIYDTELWVTDGTETGTVQVKDINSTLISGSETSTYNSNPSNLTLFNGLLYFSAAGSYDTSNYIYDTELWVTDGTETGTVQVKDINSTLISGSETSTYSSNPSNLTVFNGLLYFSAAGSYDTSNYIYDTELWVTDGTEIGTVQVKDINTTLISGSETSTYNSNPSNLTVFNGLLYFSADDGTTGTELWETDGTEAGTAMLTDIYTGEAAGSDPSNLTVFNNKLYFTANDGTNGTELWSTDGTKAGAVMLTDIYTGEAAGSDPSNLTVFNNKLYFKADDGATNGRELWATDGTSTDVLNLNAGSDAVNSFTYYDQRKMRVYKNKLYFYTAVAPNNSDGAFYVTDGTVDGTIRLADAKGVLMY